MTVVDAEGQALWISEQLDLPVGVVEAVLALEFEFMVGVGIIELPEEDLRLFTREELRHRSPVVDIEELSLEAEDRIGVFCEVAKMVLIKESEYLEMRGLIV